jgi:hypothetical protein
MQSTPDARLLPDLKVVPTRFAAATVEFRGQVVPGDPRERFGCNCRELSQCPNLMWRAQQPAQLSMGLYLKRLSLFWFCLGVQLIIACSI